MTEEQIKQKFKETYPDFMRGDEPLSPYFDIWEYGIELATKELQEENEELQAKWLSESYDKAKLVEQIEVKDIQIRELEQQRQYWKDSSFDWRHKFFKKDKVKRLVKKDKQLNYAKSIIKSLLDNSDEYAEQRARDFIKE